MAEAKNPQTFTAKTALKYVEAQCPDTAQYVHLFERF